MEYRKDKYGNSLSILGYGCLRFSKRGASIDLDKTERELMSAIEGGVNYLDTAYIYPGSEAAVGKILERNHCRDRVYLATKLPHYLMRSVEGAEKCFQEQLRRLRTDHVDYYLMHMLTDVGAWRGLCKMGIDRWLREKQAAGQIGQIGFSYHGNSDMFCQLVDAWDWDFCQIQYNYLDEHSQAGRTGLQYAAAKGLPVIIMEPLRGGRLVQGLSPKARALFAETGKSPARWALQWLWAQPEVTVVLSGMNSLDMVQENLQGASEASEWTMSQEDYDRVEQVRQEIQKNMKVPCTGCRYCMPCPFGVDIPGSFHAYNMRAAEGWFSGMRQYVMCTLLRSTPSYASMCHQCGKCEQHCPQGIPVREKLREVAKNMEGLPFHAAKLANKTLKLWK